jgi:hypothetical protein
MPEARTEPAPDLAELMARIAAYVRNHPSGTVSLNFNAGRIESVDFRSHEKLHVDCT